LTGAFDAIIQAAGYISAHTGGVPDGNAVLVPKHDADAAMDAAECMGAGPASRLSGGSCFRFGKRTAPACPGRWKA
jgi:succinate dehydrogenase / fumarate reductase iron-sulfur subunit